jgi:hypothetical protein
LRPESLGFRAFWSLVRISLTAPDAGVNRRSRLRTCCGPGAGEQRSMSQLPIS